jgi:hypothetical protein
MKSMIALAAGTLALVGCAAPRSTETASAVAPGATSGSTLVGSTLVDCGEGRRALVQQANGASSVQCVPAPAALPVSDAGYIALPPGAQQGLALPASGQPSYRQPAYGDVVVPQQRSVTASPVSYRSYPSERRVVARGRTWKKSAAIIGGSTAAGAGVGAVLAGGSGAKKGAVVGLLGGTIYDIATRNR